MGNHIFNITQLHLQVKNMKTEIKGNKDSDSTKYYSHVQQSS